MFVLIINLVWSLVLKREPEISNPWFSRGLEWQLPSPPPVYNFEEIPVVHSHPYDYGVVDAPPVAELRPTLAPPAPTEAGA
jgi:cytochrome c oxidase subunit 1